MTDQHRATPEQMSMCVYPGDIATDPRKVADVVNALSDRIAALEAGQTCPHIVSSDEGTSYCALAEQTHPKPTPNDRQIRSSAPADSLVERVAQELAKPATWHQLVEINYGSDCTTTAQQILRAPMVVEGTFEHGGETYQFKAKPERATPMAELRAASADAQPGWLVERVETRAGGDGRAAIREVAAWLRTGRLLHAAELLEQEADRG